VIALPARPLIRWRGWVIATWAALALLFAPRACHVQRVLAVRGALVESTESARASQLIKAAFPNPIADYVAIVVHGPVRWTHPRFETVLDSLSAAIARRPYVSQVVSVRTIGESTFVSKDRRTTFLIAALTPGSTSDLSRTVVPDLRAVLTETKARVPSGAEFDVMVTGNPALDYDVRTISAEDTQNNEEQVLPLTLIVLVLALAPSSPRPCPSSWAWSRSRSPWGSSPSRLSSRPCRSSSSTSRPWWDWASGSTTRCSS
jgi:predicted RND superfamily exporter protein